MKKPKLLDAFAILRWTQKEKGWKRVRELLELAQKGREILFMSQINLCEVYYKTIQILGREEAGKFLDAFHLLPITVVHPTDEIIWRAAEIKAEHPMSLADCFAASTALEKEATILTGHPDFKKVEHIVPIEWM